VGLLDRVGVFEAACSRAAPDAITRGRADASSARRTPRRATLPGGMLTEPISRTALLTAAARARETEREGAILRDPYARALAGDEGMRMLDAQGDERPIASLAVRGRFLDDALATALARGVRGVVLLAAGTRVDRSARAGGRRAPRPG
jgi:hypothetical protein